MTIFERMHLHLFDWLYGLNGLTDEEIGKLASQAGVDPEELKTRMQDVRVGNVYNHAHATTVVPLLERIFSAMQCTGVTLKIDLEHVDDPDVYVGHISIEVTDIRR